MTFPFSTNIEILKDKQNVKSILNYEYEKMDGDEIVFAENISDAYEKVINEGSNLKIGKNDNLLFFAGKYPKETEEEKFFIGFDYNGKRKLYVY